MNKNNTNNSSQPTGKEIKKQPVYERNNSVGNQRIINSKPTGTPPPKK